MTRLAPPAYLDHLRAESRRFREVLAGCDPAARVPGCPEWDATDLLWHLACVQEFWARTVRERPAPSHGNDEPPRPADHATALAAFDRHSAALVEVLAAADPAEEAWTWAEEQTVGFTYRRQALEALVHRLDAEQTAGTVTPLDPALAADGVEECLDVIFGGVPPWGAFTPGPAHVRIDCTDTGDATWANLGRFVGTDPRDGAAYDDDDLHVVADPGVPADATVAGPAGTLLAWLWRRGDDTGITVEGDRSAFDRFRRSVDHPVN